MHFYRMNLQRWPRRQQGVVLVVALIFLMLLTILAISASGSSLIQEKMVAATRNSQLSEWGAETALRGAEWRLWSANAGLGNRITCGSNLDISDCYEVDPQRLNQAVIDFRTSPGWGAQVNRAGTSYNIVYPAISSSAASPVLAANPVVLIEDLGMELPPGTGSQSEYLAQYKKGYEGIARHVYRITARSTGGNDNAVSVVQTTFSAKSE